MSWWSILLIVLGSLLGVGLCFGAWALCRCASLADEHSIE